MNLKGYKVKFIEWLIKERPHIVDLMKNTSHHGDNSLSPYHLEDSVWTHTCMVYNLAIKNYPDDKLVHIAAMLHDIGKCYCFTEEFIEDKTIRRFMGHEGRSLFESVGLLIDYNNDTGSLLSDKEITNILFAVGLHGRLYESKTFDHDSLGVVGFELRNLLLKLIECDISGRIVADNKDRKLGIPISDTNKILSLPERTLMVDSCDVVLLIGPPGSGKSSIAENLLKTGYDTVISRDDIVMSLAHQGSTYTEAFKSVDHKEVDRLLMIQYSKALKDNLKIVVDMTNMTKKSRRKFIIPAKQKGLTVGAIIKLTPSNKAIKNRAFNMDKHVPQSVIKSMMNKFTIPLGDEVDAIASVLWKN